MDTIVIINNNLNNFLHEFNNQKKFNSDYIFKILDELRKVNTENYLMDIPIIQYEENIYNWCNYKKVFTQEELLNKIIETAIQYYKKIYKNNRKFNKNLRMVYKDFVAMKKNINPDCMQK